MSRPRTPTKVLKLRGSFRKDPQRGKAREHEPEPTGPLGDPPKEFNEAQAARWREIATWCDWLTIADRFAVERVARLMTAYRDGKASTAEQKQLDTLLGRLGMTPSDRSKVQVPPSKKKPANPFDVVSA